MKHRWTLIAQQFLVMRHRCKNCGAMRLTTHSTTTYPKIVYTSLEGVQYQVSPKCEKALVT